MRTFDLTHLHRNAIGFDRLLALLQNSAGTQTSYPPYNIEILDDNRYRISMAVAGFSRKDIEITTQRTTLSVHGRQSKEENRKFLHRGMALRDFQQSFELAEHVTVTSASFDNGMLHIDLVRDVPEAQKPRRIDILSAATQETQAAELAA